MKTAKNRLEGHNWDTANFPICSFSITFKKLVGTSKTIPTSVGICCLKAEFQQLIALSKFWNLLSE